jgi:hypothetical protein
MWLTYEEAMELLPARHWLRKVMRRAEQLRRLLPEQLKEEFIQNGFDI